MGEVTQPIPEENVAGAYRLLKEYLRTGDARLLEAMKKEHDDPRSDIYLPKVKMVFHRPGLTIVNLETGEVHRCDDRVEFEYDVFYELRCTERGKPVTVEMGKDIRASRLALLAFLMEQGVDILSELVDKTEQACRRRVRFHEEVTGKKLKGVSCDPGKRPHGGEPMKLVYEQYKRLLKVADGFTSAHREIIELLSTPMPEALRDALRSALAPYNGYEVECMLRPEDSDKAPWIDVPEPTRLRVTLELGEPDFLLRVDREDSTSVYLSSFGGVVYACLCMPDLMKKALNGVREILEEEREMIDDIARIANLVKQLRDAPAQKTGSLLQQRG